MEEKLIALIKNEGMLYNRNDHHYRNVKLRHKKFEKFSKELQIPAEKLKKRWRSLRDGFFKEMRRMQLSSESNSPTPKRKWKHFDQLMFLKDYINDNNTPSESFKFKPELNDDDSLVLSSLFKDCKSSIHVPQEQLEDEVTQEQLDNEVSQEHLEESFVNIQNEPMSSPSSGKIKPTIIDLNTSESFLSLLNIAKSVFTSRPTAEQTKTSVELFFDSIKQQVEVANISPKEFGQLQIEILQTVNKYLYKTK